MWQPCPQRQRVLSPRLPLPSAPPLRRRWQVPPAVRPLVLLVAPQVLPLVVPSAVQPAARVAPLAAARVPALLPEAAQR